MPDPTGTAADLDRKIGALGGKALARSTELLGCYDLVGCAVSVEQLPARPTDPPGRVRVEVPQNRAQLAPAFFSTPERKRATEDFLARRVAEAIDETAASGDSEESAGGLSLGRLGQAVLERTVIHLGEDSLVLRLAIHPPHRSGKLVSAAMADLLLRQVPAIVQRALLSESLSEPALRRQVNLVEDQTHVRARLEGSGLVAFLANGIVAPRRPDGSDLPLDKELRVAFRAPERTQMTVNAPNSGAVIGVGLPRGVTLLTGGFGHGKSTLLEAIAQGVHDHVPGDGRERLVTARNALTLVAEPGRSVRQVDVSPFCSQLPSGQFSSPLDTDAAPAGLAEAASLMEAVELGATTILVDEDRVSASWLYRDARTQQLLSREHEPLTTLLDQARELYNSLGVSSIIATSNPGDYVDVADTVLTMHKFCPHDVSARAKTVAAAMPTRRQLEIRRPVYRSVGRQPLPDGVRELCDSLPLCGLQQLTEESQARAIAYAVRRLAAEYLDGDRNLPECLSLLAQDLDTHGVEVLYGDDEYQPPLSRPRAVDVGAALNRLAGLRVTLGGEEHP